MSDTTTAERMIKAGHKPRLDDDGDIDHFAFEMGFHNGPVCEVCHASRCEHCDDGRPFEPCPGEEEVARRDKEKRRAQYEELKREFEEPSA